MGLFNVLAIFREWRISGCLAIYQHNCRSHLVFDVFYGSADERTGDIGGKQRIRRQE